MSVDQPRELLDRIGEVAAGVEEDRLRPLLDTVVAAGLDRDPHEALERLVVAACRLTDARYGVLGVLSDAGRPTEFVTHGFDPQTPAESGLLSLPDVGEHRPADLDGFLGVPVRFQDRAVGHLYLTGKRTAAAFSEADEQVLVALAATAGAVIENARLHRLAQRRQRWLAVTAEVVNAVAEAPDRDVALALVARRAREVAQAALVVVLLHDEATGSLTVATVDAAEPIGGLAEAVLPVTGTAFEVALRDQRHIALDDVGDAGPWPVPLPSLRASLAPFGGVRGVLLVAYPSEAREQDEPTLLSLFAGQAAITLDREQARIDQEALLVLSDRERIARDLHDVVIQRLFAIGLRLQTAASMVLRPEVGVRINQAVDDLDATIRDIRGAIFELRSPAVGSIRAELRALVDRVGDSLGFRPTLRLDGPIDSTVPRELAGDVLAVLGEALSNVVRHAGASRAEVQVTATGERLTVIVTDNGRGGAIPASGLANLLHRAEQRGGQFSVESGEGEGTRLVWTTPLAL